jgi:hypothetical protein
VTDDSELEFEPFTDQDLEDICLGDIWRAGGHLALRDVATDFSRGEVRTAIDNGISRGLLRLGDDEVITLTAAGRDFLHRDRSVSVHLPGVEPPGDA